MATWRDRVVEAAYTGPDGTRQTFLFVDVAMTARTKRTPHEFTSADATFVEDQGLKGDQFPLRAYFSGDNHDLEAKAFLALLTQRGPGRLEHPFYGTHTVLAVGDIQRSDALVSGGNESIITVTFWKTIESLYPGADADALQLVDDAVNSYDGFGAQQFEDSLEIAGAAERSTFGADMRALKDGADKGLRAAQDGTGKLRGKMDRVSKAIDSTIDTFISDPLTLAFQMRQLVGAPARSKQLLRQRLDAYANLATSLIEGRGTGAGAGTGTSGDGTTGVLNIGISSPKAIAEASNRFHANRLVAEHVVLSVALATTGATYRTRQHALDAAIELGTMHDSVADWSELNYAALLAVSPGPDATAPHSSGVGAIDVGDSRQIVLQAVTRAMSFLINKSFTLGIERSILIDVPRTAIDTVTELYGDIDRLDEFMEANAFNGNEILEIPAGTTVKYYVD